MSAIDYDIRRLARRWRRQGSAWATSARPGIRMIETQCARIRTRIAGHGSRTLVFACDMPNVVESYDEIIRLLGRDFRIVCFEQTGFGFSYPKAGFRFTRRSYIDAMVEMLKVLDMGPYTLVSPCVNVFTALPVAAENPSLIEGLVLMQAICWQEQCAWAGWAMGRFMLATAYIPAFGSQLSATPYLGQWIWSRVERSFARRTHPHVIYRSKERVERFRQIADPLYAAHDHGACTCFASAFQNYFDSAEEIPRASQPSLVLWASADRGHANSDPRALLAYAPHANWIEIPDTGHHLELENPEAVTGAIRTFLA
jgi:pimeloyl-ACP methyl ester carboxylesterase